MGAFGLEGGSGNGAGRWRLAARPRRTLGLGRLPEVCQAAVIVTGTGTQPLPSLSCAASNPSATPQRVGKTAKVRTRA
eukprot:204487-Rhodomonas_salina.2